MRLTRLLHFTAVLAAGLMAGDAFAAEPASVGKPNIVLILADDLGLPNVGAYGGVYKTPNLDALAAGGTKFDRCFANPLCGPSRATLLFGRYVFRTGVFDNGFGAAATPDKEIAIAKVLKQAGYATAVSGKWAQLQYLTTKEDGLKWGWDEFLAWGPPSEDSDGKGRGNRYWDPHYNLNGKTLTQATGKYGPDVAQDFVIDFIRRHKNEPFFVYYPTPLVHGPILPTPDSTGGDRTRDDPADEQIYADNVAYLDKQIGQLVRELDALKLREKTLILFVGDNGIARPGAVLAGRAVDGKKGQLREGGSRVPLIANWPGTTPAGVVRDDLVDFTDFYATLAELGGGALPENHPLDSHSFAPQLLGQKGDPRKWAFVQLRSRWYARSDRWKLDQSGQLFDMRDAPFAEHLVPADSTNPAAVTARKALQKVLDTLNPAATPPAEKPADAALKKKQKLSRQKANAT